MKKLWKTTLVIWTQEDPSSWSLSELGFEADQGCAICTDGTSVEVDSTECDRRDFFFIDEESADDPD